MAKRWKSGIHCRASPQLVNGAHCAYAWGNFRDIMREKEPYSWILKKIIPETFEFVKKMKKLLYLCLKITSFWYEFVQNFVYNGATEYFLSLMIRGFEYLKISDRLELHDDWIPQIPSRLGNATGGVQPLATIATGSRITRRYSAGRCLSLG